MPRVPARFRLLGGSRFRARGPKRGPAVKASSFSSSKKHSELPPAFSSGIFPSIFELFPDPLIISDWKSGRFLWSNRAAEKALGYSRSALREMDISTLLPESMMDRLPSILREEQRKNGLSVRTTLRRKTGEPLPVEMRTRLVREGEDTVRCIIARDLSGDDLPDAEDSPRDTAVLFPRLFGEQEMVFEISPEGYLASGNAACLQKTGYTRNDLREGVPFDRIIPPEERERAQRDFERLRRGERLEALEYTIVHKDGSALPVILSFSPAPARRVRGVALDITEHRRVEHELVIREKLNMLGELAGGVVHNFNNILTVILGYLELLSAENLDENGQRVIQNIRRAALDGADIVHRIQNFSNSSEPTEIKPADLNEVVREVLEFMKPRYTAPGPSYTVDARLQTIPPVRMIPFEMREVLSNVIMNAFDAMPEGGALTVSTEAREGFAALIVTDTGIGMSEETRRRLFEPFFTTKGKKGTGIGMSVSYAIIGKFGGEIQVNSAEGRGATVTILLRYAPAVPAVETSAVPENPPEPCSILVIDDEENICEILDEFLSRAGHRVTTAYGGEEGLALLNSRHFDILITDLNMPGVSGLEIARHVRKISPDTYSIMLTGWGARVEELSRDEQMVNHLLIKPISFSALAEVIERAAAR